MLMLAGWINRHQQAVYWTTDFGRPRKGMFVVESSRLRIISDRNEGRTRRFQPRGRGSFGVIRAWENFL